MKAKTRGGTQPRTSTGTNGVTNEPPWRRDHSLAKCDAAASSPIAAKTAQLERPLRCAMPT